MSPFFLFLSLVGPYRYVDDANNGEEGRYERPGRRLPPLAVDDVHQDGHPAKRNQNSSALQTEDAPFATNRACTCFGTAWCGVVWRGRRSNHLHHALCKEGILERRLTATVFGRSGRPDSTAIERAKVTDKKESACFQQEALLDVALRIARGSFEYSFQCRTKASRNGHDQSTRPLPIRPDQYTRPANEPPQDSCSGQLKKSDCPDQNTDIPTSYAKRHRNRSKNPPNNDVRYPHHNETWSK